MNWKIIIQLSLFGLIMAVATVSLIPEDTEPAFWLFIFVFSAWVIAKVCPGKYFLHGFLTAIANCIWITAVHVVFRDAYLAHHPQVVSMSRDFPRHLARHRRLVMILTAPVLGLMFGIILGLFSVVASKIVKKGSSD